MNLFIPKVNGVYTVYTREELQKRLTPIEEHSIGVCGQMTQILGQQITITEIFKRPFNSESSVIFKCEELPLFWFPVNWLRYCTELGNEF
jgi:hypothetical protein